MSWPICPIFVHRLIRSLVTSIRNSSKLFARFGRGRACPSQGVRCRLLCARFGGSLRVRLLGLPAMTPREFQFRPHQVARLSGTGFVNLASMSPCNQPTATLHDTPCRARAGDPTAGSDLRRVRGARLAIIYMVGETLRHLERQGSGLARPWRQRACDASRQRLREGRACSARPHPSHMPS